MDCLAKLNLNLLPNQFAGSASRSGHTPRTRTPRECPPAFRIAPAVAETGSTMRRSVPQPSAIGSVRCHAQCCASLERDDASVTQTLPD